MISPKNIIITLLIIVVAITLVIGVQVRKAPTDRQAVNVATQHETKSASGMSEDEATRYLMTQIYQSDEFMPDEAEQLPSVWGESVKNRLFWRPTSQDLDANLDWVNTLKYPSEDNAPAGYFIASPMLLHRYEDHGTVYAFMFAQTATRGYSHASGSDIGAGVFKKENDTWKPIFISKNINDGMGAFGNAGKIFPLMIGKNKYAYKNELTNMGQGAIFDHADLYYFDGTTFNNVLSTVAMGSDGMDCENRDSEINEWREIVTIHPEEVPNSDFFDLLLKRGGTMPKKVAGECIIVPSDMKIERYRWTGAKYELK